MNRQAVHILHVVPTLSAGGLELALSRIVRGTSELGFRHSIVCLRGNAVIRNRFDSSVDIFCMHARPNELALPLRLRRIIKQIRPTVIHARNWSAWPDVALARLLVSPRVPLIFSFHGVSEASPMPLRRRLAFRALTPITTYIFTVSEATKQFLVGHVGLPARRVDVIPNGIDAAKFRPARRRAESIPRIIGTVGNLTPVKNQAMLIRACAELTAGGTDLEVRIAGVGPEKTHLLELAGGLNISDRVGLIGHVADIPAFLHELDAFVLCSDSEAHPNALLEAMACGLPCVGTRVGGVPEVLDDGRAGLLIEAGDQGALAGALAELLADPARRIALGQAGRDRVCRRYSLDQMTEAYAAVYMRRMRRGTILRQRSQSDGPRDTNA